MYHISPTTGNPNKCGAKPGNCPFGAPAEHYESKEAARTAYEGTQGEIFAVSHTPIASASALLEADEESLGVAAPGAFPIDEARDELTQPGAEARLQEIAEKAFASTLADVDEDVKDRLFFSAERRGAGIPGAVLNEYVDYADLMEEVRQPGEAASLEEPQTDEGRAVASAKNPLTYAFAIFRGKSDVPPRVARDVLEHTFPVSANGLSEAARAKVFELASARAERWNDLIEEYRDALELAAAVKGAPKRSRQELPPRNVEAATRRIITPEQAKHFLGQAEELPPTAGPNVRATVKEIAESLREREEFAELLRED
jgi:hypothetical protein